MDAETAGAESTAHSDQYLPGARRQLCFDTFSASAVNAGLGSSHTDVGTKL